MIRDLLKKNSNNNNNNTTTHLETTINGHNLQGHMSLFSQLFSSSPIVESVATSFNYSTYTNFSIFLTKV